jgi:hypothetical protein
VFSKTIVQLKADEAGQYPSDNILQENLRRLGFEIQFKSDPVEGMPKQFIITDLPDHKGKIVETASTWHYRDRAYSNISKMGNASVTKEIERYAIYYGASSRFEASMAVTRVNQGEICIFVSQNKLDQCAGCTEYVMNKLKNNNLSLFDFDDKNKSAIVHLFSTTSGANIASGRLISRKFLGYLMNSPIETLIAIFLFLLAISTFLLGFYFPQYIDSSTNHVIDPLTKNGRVFVERAWPASFISSLTAFLTLWLSFKRFSRDGVEWDWKL